MNLLPFRHPLPCRMLQRLDATTNLTTQLMVESIHEELKANQQRWSEAREQGENELKQLLDQMQQGSADTTAIAAALEVNKMMLVDLRQVTEAIQQAAPGHVELDQASSIVWVDGLLALCDSEPDAHLSASRLALLSWKDRLAHGPVPRGLSPRGDWKPERSAVIEL